jgi:pantetheine-phosphate adenylyltransferase
VIRRGVALFDQVVVAVGINPEKRELFNIDERLEIITELLRSIPGAKAAKYEGLTVDFVRSVECDGDPAGHSRCFRPSL